MDARRWFALMLAGTCAACARAGAPPDAPEADAVADVADARAFLEGIPARLAAGGPMAWLETFEGTPSFMMASDGAVAFADRDGAAVFLAEFASTVDSMSLTWHDIEVVPLGQGTVSVAASYEEEIRMSDGSTLAFGGYMTGVAREDGGGWRFQHLHWSSPVPPGG